MHHVILWHIEISPNSMQINQNQIWYFYEFGNGKFTRWVWKWSDGQLNLMYILFLDILHSVLTFPSFSEFQFFIYKNIRYIPLSDQRRNFIEEGWILCHDDFSNASVRKKNTFNNRKTQNWISAIHSIFDSIYIQIKSNVSFNMFEIWPIKTNDSSL